MQNKMAVGLRTDEDIDGTFEEMLERVELLEESLLEKSDVEEEPVVQEMRVLFAGIPTRWGTVCSRAYDKSFPCDGAKIPELFDNRCQNQTNAHRQCGYLNLQKDYAK
jgi:hypothetical protein